MKKIRRGLVILFFLAITLLFFRPVFRGLVPIPLDIMAGAYYPWLDSKWGYSVGVPVKNPSVTDVFSQLYPWRVVAMDTWRTGEVPLWNPFSFSGTPLLANWQSAPFYPLNIFMLILGNINGWTMMIMLQPLMSMVFMYAYLKEIGLKKLSSIAGSIVFAFSGFMITYMEYGTAGQIFMWLPLQLLAWEKYFKSKDWKWLVLVSVICFPMLTAGFFQPVFYSLALSGIYGLVRASQDKSQIKGYLTVILVMCLGLGLAAVQLLPTFELLNLSIRNVDHNIYEYHFGLLPLKNVTTFWVPDFFGNPATNNFWGFMGYQETSGYWGIVAMVFVFSSLFIRKKDWQNKFFVISLLASLLLAFDTPLGEFIYKFKIPFLSTGYASRWLLVSSFSASILVAYGLDKAKKREINLGIMIVIAGWVGIGLGLGISKLILNSSYLKSFEEVISDASYTAIGGYTKIALRNMVVPGGLFIGAVLSYWLMKSTRLWTIVFCIFIFVDIFRYGAKFTSFSKPEFASTKNMPVFEFLKDNVGNYRIDKENAPLLPSNSWIYAGLMSPSGYDPLIYKDYAEWYKVYANGQVGRDDGSSLADGWFTRYLNLDNYTSPITDFGGVKYLIALKQDDKGLIDQNGDKLRYNIPQDKFKKVFDYGTTVVLENTEVMPRALLYGKYTVISNQIEARDKFYLGFNYKDEVILDKKPNNSSLSDEGKVEIVSYSNNKVRIEVESKTATILVLTDTNYPGWEATVNGNKEQVLTADGIYRAVEVPGGENTIEFTYKPKSFLWGLILSCFSAIVLLVATIVIKWWRWPKRNI